MTDFGRRAGEGDMLKSTYDPNEDGVIALPQTEADITAAGVAVLIGIHAALANVHHTLPDVAGLITTHAGVSAAHHAQGQTEAEVDALIATHADLPNVHHTPPTADPGEGFVFIDPGAYDEIIQGTIYLKAAATSYHVGPIQNIPGNDQDEVNWKAYLAAGTYTVVYIGRRDTNCGIIDIYIDATEVASHDMYAGSGEGGIIKKQTGIVVASSDIKTIRLIVDGKNVSSSAYTFVMESMVFYRTA